MGVFSDMIDQIGKARAVKMAAQENARDLADLLDGNLKALRPIQLERLKKQLSHYNIKTKTWTD